MTREELIATIVTDRYSGFRDGDETILAAASDARLEEFRAAADVHKNSEARIAKLETDLRQISARLKVADERLKAAEQPLSLEDFLAKAPPEIKTLLDAKKAEEDAFRAALVSQLKDLGVDTEDKLKTKTTDELRTLARYARVQLPDFSGRALARDRTHTLGDNNDDYTPPNPYEAGIQAWRERQKSH